MHECIHKTFNGVDNHAWVELLCISPEHPRINNCLFPSFPDENTQINMVGSAYAQALREVALLYHEIHHYAKKCNLSFNENTRMLDFGCGFGRLLRFFMKDIAPSNLIGTDVTASFIDICNNTFSDVIFNTNNPFPPILYPDNSFDIVYAYSVFSHLSEKAHLAWLKEIHRILRPGGLVFLTLRQRSFLYQCTQSKKDAESSSYNEYIAYHFGDIEKMMEKYVRGEYIYVPMPSEAKTSLTGDFYGDTIIPPRYIEKVWKTYFTTVDTFDNLKRMAQALIVLQK